MTDHIEFSAKVKKITHTLKEDKDGETGEVIGHHTETAIQLASGDGAEALRELAEMQGDGDLRVTIETRNRKLALRKRPTDGRADDEERRGADA
jgi:hypothetical protein